MKSIKSQLIFKDADKEYPIGDVVKSNLQMTQQIVQFLQKQPVNQATTTK